MRKRNLLIIALFITGALGMTIVEAQIKPEMERQQEQYRLDQLNPLTHDFQSVLPYKNKYMGNAGNLINLNYHLPLGDIVASFQLYPEELTAEVFYDRKAADLDEKRLKQALLYNSTANFVLIDNLQALKLSFNGTSYTITREAVEKWYGDRFKELQDNETWKKEVQGPLADPAYARRFYEQNVAVES
ncbi:DUF4825 domain-containing protein [Brevibacillus sp. B_LB10_24]|uniref:DUF4825 domain-containing protein n=1 Tax=Brevibacillus sp. B_LB10_24 TaxID=3380645 RepID=UPI0038B7FA8F